MRRQNIKQKLKEYFFLNPIAKLRVRQLERTVGVPLPSVIRYVKELEKERILTRITFQNTVFYTADRTSSSFLSEKKLFNLHSVYASGILNFLINEYHNPIIILFGSYARGEDTENSDVDLYVETHKRSASDLSSFEKKLSRPIQLFLYKNLSEIRNKELSNNIVNGIVLNGFLEVFK
ncbi:nucleotidyltransferase domain-containing protein [Candidatus Woesearchaeota archaeon]|nr:nucleotidyltransferase domain-containing protein [Candidatus Woesearchaeota archaeon]